MTRLKEQYEKKIVPALKAKLGRKNTLAVPRLVKVVINVGFGRQAKEKEYIDRIESSLTRLSGQKPVLTKARKSVSSFKIREGMIIGAKVTLRGQRMYDFVEKLVRVTFARVRDFRGIDQQAVDRAGNMTIGFKEHLPFPEIGADEVDNIFGLEVCLDTTARSRADGLALFNELGFPFKKQ